MQTKQLLKFNDLVDGHDVHAFIVSENINRRHMTKGQRAMAVAMIYPESRQGKKDTSKKNLEVNSQYLRQARTILRHNPEWAQDVIKGTTTLSDAYKRAKGLGSE